MASPSLPREKIPWFPSISYDLCKGTKDCLAFCPTNVFAWDETRAAPPWPIHTVVRWVAPIVCGFVRIVRSPFRIWRTSRLR